MGLSQAFKAYEFDVNDFNCLDRTDRETAQKYMNIFGSFLGYRPNSSEMFEEITYILGGIANWAAAQGRIRRERAIIIKNFPDIVIKDCSNLPEDD